MCILYVFPVETSSHLVCGNSFFFLSFSHSPEISQSPESEEPQEAPTAEAEDDTVDNELPAEPELPPFPEVTTLTLYHTMHTHTRIRLSMFIFWLVVFMNDCFIVARGMECSTF